MKNKSCFCIVFKVKISIFSKAVPQIIPTYSKAVPARTIWRRPMMVRQTYSVAVLSTRGRLHPLVPEGFCPQEQGEPKRAKRLLKRGLVRKVEPSLMVKKDGMILELPSLMVRKVG